MKAKKIEETIMMFWILMPRSLICRWQRFGEIYCLHLQGRSGDVGKWRVLKLGRRRRGDDNINMDLR
jgi:hypothetical protein